MTWCLMYLARVAAARGDAGRAGLLFGAAEAEEARSPVNREEPDRVELIAPLLEIDDPAFERGRADGRRLTLKEAVERALDGE